MESFFRLLLEEEALPQDEFYIAFLKERAPDLGELPDLLHPSNGSLVETFKRIFRRVYPDPEAMASLVRLSAEASRWGGEELRAFLEALEELKEDRSVPWRALLREAEKGIREGKRPEEVLEFLYHVKASPQDKLWEILKNFMASWEFIPDGEEYRILEGLVEAGAGKIMDDLKKRGVIRIVGGEYGVQEEFISALLGRLGEAGPVDFLILLGALGGFKDSSALASRAGLYHFPGFHLLGIPLSRMENWVDVARDMFHGREEPWKLLAKQYPLLRDHLQSNQMYGEREDRLVPLIVLAALNIDPALFRRPGALTKIVNEALGKSVEIDPQNPEFRGIVEEKVGRRLGVRNEENP